MYTLTRLALQAFGSMRSCGHDSMLELRIQARPVSAAQNAAKSGTTVAVVTEQVGGRGAFARCNTRRLPHTAGIWLTRRTVWPHLTCIDGRCTVAARPYNTEPCSGPGSRSGHAAEPCIIPPAKSLCMYYCVRCAAIGHAAMLVSRIGFGHTQRESLNEDTLCRWRLLRKAIPIRRCPTTLRLPNQCLSIMCGTDSSKR